jgi:hypothetical protein
MGRPSRETPEIKAAILERIAEGEPLAQICRDPAMPCMSAVNNWRRADPEFDGDFARARECGHDVIATRVRDVARGGDGSSGDVQRDRLIVETDLKLLAKWDKRYSDKTLLGSDPDNPLPATTVTLDASLLSDAALKEVLAARSTVEKK